MAKRNTGKKDTRSPQQKEFDQKRDYFNKAKSATAPRNGKEAAERKYRQFQRQGKPNSKASKDQSQTSDNANDPQWYIRNDVLAKNVASFSFNNALGGLSRIKFDHDGGAGTGTDFEWRAPGILNIFTGASVGSAIDETSPINIAAKNIYTFVRHQNSGHTNYDSPDLMLYILAMDSVYSVIAWWSRALGIAKVFSQTNRYVGDAMLSAMGFIPSEFRANINQIRGWLNMYIVKAAAFCVPNTMSYYVRHYWMYNNIFKDEDVVKSQFYMYSPAYVFQYIESSGGPGYLKAVDFCLAPHSSGQYLERQERLASAWQTSCEILLQKLQASEDINIMSGDILKAYGRENIWNMGLVPDDYVTMPIFSEEVLDQIHNTVFCSRTPIIAGDLSQVDTNVNIETFNIYQDPAINAGNLLCQPKFINAPQLAFDQLVDINQEEPDPERVMVATRNLVVGGISIGNRASGGQDVGVSHITGSGSELPLFGDLTMYDGITNTLQHYPVYYTGANVGTGNAVPALSQFNKRPRYYQMATAVGVPAVIASIAGEIDNYTVLSHNDIKKVHESALLSMFGVPFYGIAGK